MRAALALSVALWASFGAAAGRVALPSRANPEPIFISTVNATAGGMDNPLAGRTGDFCVGADFNTSKLTWYNSTQYALLLLSPAGAWPAPNSLLLWMANGQLNATLVDASSNVVLLNGAYFSATYREFRATACLSRGRLTLLVNGGPTGTPQTVAGGWTQPAKLRWFGATNAFTTAPPSSSISNICFSRQRAGVASNTDPAVSIAPGCGEFQPFPRGTVTVGAVPAETTYDAKVALVGDSQCDSNTNTFFLMPTLETRLRSVVGSNKQVRSFCINGARAVLDRADTVTAASALTQFTTWVAGQGYDVVVVMAGINDLLTGRTDTETAADLTTLYDAVRSSSGSPKLVIVNLYAIQGYGAATAQMLTYRASVRASVTAYGSANNVPVVDPEDVTTSVCGSACFDGLHWSNATVLPEAAAIGKAVGGVYGG